MLKLSETTNKAFEETIIDKDMMSMSVIERMQSIEEEKPCTVLALDDFNFYLGRIKNKSIRGLSEEEFIKIKNEFVLAIENDICGFYKFANGKH